ncbi:uncharacterized protein LOC141665387 [Apium graveolens]|uniref:uncharacterized protein LOC141665387 n=1 Tax=Apium graveolens TaxID=4045 RepID=UPI003D7A2E09
MDETGLFYRLEVDHSLATKQLEGRKKDKERITIAVCCNGDGSDKMLEADSPNLEKINILDAINFATMAWSFDVTTKTIANCFRHYKIRSEEVDVPEVEDGQLEQEIQDLTKFLSKLNYRNVMNVEHLLNYPEENNAVMDSPTDEEIIEAVLNDEANDPEPDDSITIPQVSSREAFQAIVTIKNYLL